MPHIFQHAVIFILKLLLFHDLHALLRLSNLIYQLFELLWPVVVTLRGILFLVYGHGFPQKFSHVLVKKLQRVTQSIKVK